MFKYVPVSKQVRKLQNENQALKADVIKQAANLDYVAMMADVDLPDEDESEVVDNEC